MTMNPFTIAAVMTGCVLVWPPPSAAQIQRGAIYGTVLDTTGGVLPGVGLELTSAQTPLQTAVTGDRGEYRFRDLDPGRYTLRGSLPGFGTVVRETIIVGVGTHVEIAIEMPVATVTEELVVATSTPVLDVRRQGNVTNFDQAMLNEIPTARDPWALMQHVPGVSIFRPNVGGSESTNQAQFAARGDNGSNTMWNIDGVTITDMAFPGTSTTFYDFNTFEEVQFTTASLDARQQTGGLGINLVTKRGTNDLRGSGRVYFSNDDLQGENISSEQRAAGLTGNRITQLAEYGGDTGGPAWRNRAWFWGALSRTDVRQLAINGFPDDSIINTAAARGDVQIATPSRLSLLYHRTEKLKHGRAAGVDRPPETTLNQEGPTNIFKAEASYVAGPSLFLTARFAYVDLEFGLTPQSGFGGQVWRDFATQIWHGGFQFSFNDRQQYQTQVDGHWSRARHEVKFGFQERRTSSYQAAGWPGDATHTAVNVESLGYPTGVGLANLTRASAVAAETGTTSAYIGDVLTLDRWTLDLGVRLDRQRARNNPSQSRANGLAPSILPPLVYPGGPETVWLDLSPRLGATFRLSDKTLARMSFARFANQLGANVVTFDNAAGSSSIQYTFRDANGDRLAQLPELLAPTSVVSGVNPADPAAPFSPNRVDADLTAPASHVLVGGIEREIMPDFSAGIAVGMGRATKFMWTPYSGLTRDDFVEYRTAGTATIPSSTPVYRLAPGVTLPTGNARTLGNRGGYHQGYWNVDVTATKRLSNRWMVRGFLTQQQQREYLDDPSLSIQDPTARMDFLAGFASSFVDGGTAVSMQGGSDLVIHATRIYSVAGLYELPWGVNLSGAAYGRQGYPTVETITINRPDGLGQTPVLVDRDIDAGRFENLHLVDLRLQKTFPFGSAKATLDFDIFNVSNTAVVLRQFREATATTFRRPQEIVAPRLIRLGLRVQF